MRRFFLLFAVIVLTTNTVVAQTPADSTVFKAYLYNDENEVYMDINFYQSDVIIKGQELFGPLPGYLARKGHYYCWIVTSAEIEDNKARLEIVNDYGSEDLTATLTCVNDTTYTLRQESGSPLKIYVKGKSQKLPRTLTFKKRKR